MKSQENFGKYDPYLKFHGAIENDVTGTMHRLTTFIDGKPFRISFDAGVHQGRGISPQDKKTSGVTTVPDVILMSHSHLDHCGNLPYLSKEGFMGKVLGTEETLKGVHTTLIDSLVVMQRNTEHEFGKNKSDLKKNLREYWKFTTKFGPDIKSKKYLYEPTIVESMHKVLSKGHVRNHNIKEEDFDDFIDYHLVYLKYIYELKAHGITCPADIDNLEIANSYLPYDSQDIANIVSHFTPIPHDKEIILKKGRDNSLSTIFIPAGHIVGSSQIIVKDKVHGILHFTGDVGRVKESLYLPPPVMPGKTYGKIDTLITESTYGDKLHPLRGPEQQELMELITNTKGNVLVAAFSNNRHQDFQQFFADMRDSEKYPGFANIIICDGFTSKKFTELFQKHSSHTYNNLDHRALNRAEGKGTEKVERYLKKDEKSIVIVSSGMLNGGAIETYMHSVLSDPDGLLVITGYQAAGSRGEQILKTKKYKLNGVTHEVKSNVFQCKTFSSHADRDELMTLIGSVQANLVYLVHGEMSSKRHLGKAILDEGLTEQVCIPLVKGIKHPLGNK